MPRDYNCFISDEPDSSHYFTHNVKYPAAADPPPDKVLKFDVKNMPMSPMFDFDSHSDNDSPEEGCNNLSSTNSQNLFTVSNPGNKL